jgi:hypothetical protein
VVGERAYAVVVMSSIMAETRYLQIRKPWGRVAEASDPGVLRGAILDESGMVHLSD